MSEALYQRLLARELERAMAREWLTGWIWGAAFVGGIVLAYHYSTATLSPSPPTETPTSDEKSSERVSQTASATRV